MQKSSIQDIRRFGFIWLKPKFLFLTAFILAVIFLAIIFVGIRENQNNMLRMLTREASALMESVFISAQSNIHASGLADDLLMDNLVDVAALIEMQMEDREIDPARLNLACQILGYNRIDIIDSNGVIANSNYTGMIGGTYDSAFAVRLPLDALIRGSAGVVTFVDESENISSVDQLVAAVSGETRPGAVVLFMNYQKMSIFNRRIGIGYMIRRIGGQPGIDYIFLQTRDGVALSSRKLQPVLSIESDPFLDSLFVNDAERSRVISFEGNEVLEVCRQFISKDFAPGILRVGISLEGYHQVSRNFKVQMAILGLILFTLTFLFTTIAMSNQNYRSVATAYEQFKNITSNILGGIESAVIAVDNDQNILMINPKTERLFSIKAAQAIGKKYRDVFGTDNFLIVDLLNSGEDSVIREIGFTDRSKQKYTLLVTSSRLADREGRMQGAVSIALDITSQKQLEQQAKQAERMSELGTLAAGVAHEIRNPLNAIAIASQRLQAEYKVEEDQQGFMQLAGTIKSEIERLNSIIVEFLALARSGQMNKQPTNLKIFIDEIVQLFVNEADKLEINIRNNIASDLNLDIDPAQMKKVIGNLIKNSMEAVNSNGKIDISAETTDARIRLIIADNGPGIDPSKMSEIFTPYFTTKESGTGLGLSISHRIVTDHDGSLLAENVEPHGARFIISLPL